MYTVQCLTQNMSEITFKRENMLWAICYIAMLYSLPFYDRQHVTIDLYM